MTNKKDKYAAFYEEVSEVLGGYLRVLIPFLIWALVVAVHILSK